MSERALTGMMVVLQLTLAELQGNVELGPVGLNTKNYTQHSISRSLYDTILASLQLQVQRRKNAVLGRALRDILVARLRALKDVYPRPKMAEVRRLMYEGNITTQYKDENVPDSIWAALGYVRTEDLREYSDLNDIVMFYEGFDNAALSKSQREGRGGLVWKKYALVGTKLGSINWCTHRMFHRQVRAMNTAKDVMHPPADPDHEKKLAAALSLFEDKDLDAEDPARLSSIVVEWPLAQEVRDFIIEHSQFVMELILNNEICSCVQRTHAHDSTQPNVELLDETFRNAEIIPLSPEVQCEARGDGITDEVEVENNTTELLQIEAGPVSTHEEVEARAREKAARKAKNARRKANRKPTEEESSTTVSDATKESAEATRKANVAKSVKAVPGMDLAAIADKRIRPAKSTSSASLADTGLPPAERGQTGHIGEVGEKMATAMEPLKGAQAGVEEDDEELQMAIRASLAMDLANKKQADAGVNDDELQKALEESMASNLENVQQSGIESGDEDLKKAIAASLFDVGQGRRVEEPYETQQASSTTFADAAKSSKISSHDDDFTWFSVKRPKASKTSNSKKGQYTMNSTKPASKGKSDASATSATTAMFAGEAEGTKVVTTSSQCGDAASVSEKVAEATPSGSPAKSGAAADAVTTGRNAYPTKSSAETSPTKRAGGNPPVTSAVEAESTTTSPAKHDKATKPTNTKLNLQSTTSPKKESQNKRLYGAKYTDHSAKKANSPIVPDPATTTMSASSGHEMDTTSTAAKTADVEEPVTPFPSIDDAETNFERSGRNEGFEKAPFTPSKEIIHDSLRAGIRGAPDFKTTEGSAFTPMDTPGNGHSVGDGKSEVQFRPVFDADTPAPDAVRSRLASGKQERRNSIQFIRSRTSSRASMLHSPLAPGTPISTASVPALIQPTPPGDGGLPKQMYTEPVVVPQSSGDIGEQLSQAMYGALARPRASVSQEGAVGHAHPASPSNSFAQQETSRKPMDAQLKNHSVVQKKPLTIRSQPLHIGDILVGDVGVPSSKASALVPAGTQTMDSDTGDFNTGDMGSAVGRESNQYATGPALLSAAEDALGNGGPTDIVPSMQDNSILNNVQSVHPQILRTTPTLQPGDEVVYLTYPKTHDIGGGTGVITFNLPHRRRSFHKRAKSFGTSYKGSRPGVSATVQFPIYSSDDNLRAVPDGCYRVPEDDLTRESLAMLRRSFGDIGRVPTVRDS